MLHGGDLTEAVALFGGERGAWLDLSTGINPHSYPLPDLPLEHWKSLPTRQDLARILDAARLAYGVPTELDIIAAPGTQALIQWIARLAPKGSTAILGPTYNEHARALEKAGSLVQDISSLEEWRAQPNLVVVNPNNPDGRLLAPEFLGKAAIEAGRRGGWLIIDESFMDVSPDASVIGHCGNCPVVVLRSFGKFFGLAGLRLGFLIAPQEITGRFTEALGPWAVAGPALFIGDIALRDFAWADDMRVRLGLEAEALDRVLTDAGFTIVGGTSLYRLARHPFASRLHEHLARHHIWVRKFGWDNGLLRFGLPGDNLSLARLKTILSMRDAHASPQGVMTS